MHFSQRNFLCFGAGFSCSTNSLFLHQRQYSFGSGGIEGNLEYAAAVEHHGYVAAVSSHIVIELAPGYEGGGAGRAGVLVYDHALCGMAARYAGEGQVVGCVECDLGGAAELRVSQGKGGVRE